jgi:hypothetical protein
MGTERTIKQIALETRKIKAVFTDEDVEVKVKLPVFAWVLFDDGDVEPLFISKEYSGGGHHPQTADDIKYLSGGKLEVLNFEWED